MTTKPGNNEVTEAFEELEREVRAALETYSNVHRGRGHNSMVSTHLFEQARGIVLEHMGLSKGTFVVIFGTPRTAGALMAQLEPGSYRVASSRDVGLPLGVRALAVERKALPKSVPFLTGGGTARLVSPDWVMWATAPDRFEAGTPAIDYLAFSAHKAYAPFGTGVLLARKGFLNFSPAEMELILASGEENVGGIAALGKALVLLHWNTDPTEGASRWTEGSQTPRHARTGRTHVVRGSTPDLSARPD